jgi:hypothetical protein
MRVFRIDSRLEYEALRAPPPELLVRLREHRDELLQALADEVVDGTPPSSYGLNRCFVCGTELPPHVAIGRCDECGIMGTFPNAPATGAPYPLRVAIDGEVPDCAVADVVVLRRVVEDYSAIWHDDRELAAATYLGERIELLLERLERVGCQVRVEALS